MTVRLDRPTVAVFATAYEEAAMLQRRRFMWGIVSAALAVPAVPARAQPARRMWRVGILRPAPDDGVFRQNFDQFEQPLRDSGFVAGTNLALEFRVRPGGLEEITRLARELVRQQVDVIVAIAPVGVRAAARATASIPIVAVDLESDPVAAGFVATLARPGGNITGLFLDFPELAGKWIQILKEAVPSLRRVAVLWDPSTGPEFVRGAEMAAPVLHVALIPLEAQSPGELAVAFRPRAGRPALGRPDDGEPRLRFSGEAGWASGY